MPRNLVQNPKTEEFTCGKDSGDDINWKGNIHGFGKQGRTVILF